MLQSLPGQRFRYASRDRMVGSILRNIPIKRFAGSFHTLLAYQRKSTVLLLFRRFGEMQGADDLQHHNIRIVAGIKSDSFDARTYYNGLSHINS